MKFVVISDIHIHNYSSSQERLKACLRTITRAYEVAAENGAMVLMPGDLFDRQQELPVVVINETLTTFNQLCFDYPGVIMYAISGNHDHATTNQYNKPAVTSLTFLSEAYPLNFVLLDDINIPLKGVNVAGVPYYKHYKDFAQHLSEVKPVKGLFNILLIHQTPMGVKNPHLSPDADPKDFEGWDHVFCGHIHQHQRITPKFTLVGSPIYRDMGDLGDEKGILLFDTETNDFERIILNYYEPPSAGTTDLGNLPNLVRPKLQPEEETKLAKYNRSLAPTDLLKNYLEDTNKNYSPQLLEAGINCIK